ncbi:ParB-like protein [Limosilactobacillus frumenti DSM 13145]|uniref:ParB-like protein n=1 Tax=Limosilactobacillus frumenti DSM 13145 TaxID=1423746 RepID=A0A0R1P4L1_9LACO|nr:ParB-like protein [Limosilactobacillus frumenti DSM 13145]
MKVQNVSINDIKPYPNNPRDNDSGVEAVANSIKEFGWQQPIVVDKDNVIIVGHTRYKAAKKLGMKQVPVVVADKLTDEQVKAYRLADNKTGELTDWNDDLLDDELDDILNIDMSDFGFDLSLDDGEDQQAQEDEFDEEPPEKPKSRLGQVFQLGRHRLMCGDSTKAEDVKKLVGGYNATCY